MSLSEERYQSLGIATGQIVWVMDALGNMTDDQSNTTWRTFTGQTREEARGFGWMNALHPDDRERVARIYAQAIKTRSVYDAEYRLRRHDGKYRSVCARGVPVLTEDGKISEWVGSCLDITERKRVEEELHYKTAFLEAQVHHSIDGILVVNSQGKKILQNQRISDMWEIPQSIADDPDDKVQIRFVMNQVRYPEQFVEKVNYLYSHPNEVSRDEIELKNGKVFDRYSSPVIDRNGKHYGRIWTFRDVTERRRAEEALRESRQELNEAQRLARVGSWVWEPETDVVTWSEELYRMVGRDPASPAPSFREQSRQFTAESWKRLTAVAERALQSGAAYELELEMIRSDNQRIWVIARGEAQRDVNGTIVRLRGTVQDITERKRVDEALRKAHGEMEQRVEERTHELKIANEQLKQTNRLFHILSECNQHVVRAVSEADLMFGICRIIVDIGGYPSVWIGFAEDDHGKTVRPVAQRGFEDGYLNTLRVTWADTEMGWGPAATAIRSGQPHIVEDIQTSVRFAPWRADAMRRGYASAIGLPLAGNGRVFGALVIYAMTPDAFHAREVGVLMELASDLAYGIMAMRGREERRQAEEQVRRLAELQSAILNNTTYTVISTNAQGIITSINPAGERALGYSAEECVGKVTPTVFHHPDEMAERARIFSAELGIPIEPGFEVFVARARRNLPNEYEWLYRRKDGSSFPVLLSVTALRDSQGSIMGFLGLANDITERKRAEEALRESRQELSEAQRIAKVGNWTWDPETDRVTWSEELYRISGLDPAMPTPSYRELQRHYTPQGWERLNAAVEQALQRGTPYELDLEFIRDNGERGWIIARGEAQRDATGRIVKLRGTAQDITDRKRGEEALSESRHELTEAQRIAKVGNWSWDPELDVVTWSEELCRINGRDPASSPPKFSELQTVYTAESLQRLRPFVERALQTGMPYELELEMIRADGGRAWVTTRGEAQRAPDGRIVKLRGTVQDNTERKQAEEALYRSEQKFETIFRGSPVALCVSELETGRLIEINEALLRLMHGTSFDQMVGHTSLEIGMISLEERQKMLDALARTGHVDRLEMVGHRLDGEPLPAEVSLSQYEINGKHYLLVNIVDITARKHAEAEINRLNVDLEKRVTERTAELAAANRELETFSYSASHDLRSPLRTIDGFSKLLKEEYAARLDSEACDYLNYICTAAERMDLLIRGLLNLSHITRSRIQRRPVDLSAMANTIARELQESEPQRVARFVIAPGLSAEGDPDLLRSVLQNLLGNAWKYTSKHRQARIEFGTDNFDGETVFYVRDDGAGFDPQNVGRLFSAFQRLHGTEEFPGTGIGLTTVQRIIQRHGGRIWADGAVEKGATFYFTIPSRGQ